MRFFDFSVLGGVLSVPQLYQTPLSAVNAAGFPGKFLSSSAAASAAQCFLIGPDQEKCIKNARNLKRALLKFIVELRAK